MSNPFASANSTELESNDPHSIDVAMPAKLEDKKKEPKFGKGLSIEPIKTDRDAEWLKPIQEEGILPGPGLFMISGTTGSGKSVMICNLLGKKSMLKGYWEPDNIYIFSLSPCPILEDCLKIKKKNIIHEDDPKLLEDIVTKQKAFIEAKGFKKAKRILIICDDCAQSKTFLKSKALTTLAFAATHSRISVWLTTQSYVQIPRHIRINCHYLALFHGCRKSEVDRFMDEYESPYLSKRGMFDMIKHATNDKYSFLFVNNTVPDKQIQFRRGFETIMRLKK